MPNCFHTDSNYYLNINRIVSETYTMVYVKILIIEK